MNTVQLYKNPYPYPTYTRTLTKYKGPFQATPRNMNLQTGYVDLPLTFAEASECNYLSFTRDKITVYAWITEAEEIGGNNRFRLKYQADALRTFLNQITLGTQYVERGSAPTLLYDELLGSSDPFPEVTHQELDFGHPHIRTMVVQARKPESEGEAARPSNTPVNPSQYNFHMAHYDARDPLATTAIKNMMVNIRELAPLLIVTMYSVPYIDLSGITLGPCPINNTFRGNNEWYKFPDTGQQQNRLSTLKFITLPADLTKVDYSAQIVIPEAGIMVVPTELLRGATIGIMRNVDIFSGLTNYMLTDENGNPYPVSVRGSAVNSIPVVGDPLETYLSQNQNALSTAAMGDVATLAGGIAMLSTGNLAGGGMAIGGIQSMASRQAHIKDAANNYSNPPAFLGSALAAHYSDKFFVLVKKTKVTNATQVNSSFGYPQGRIMSLSLPTAGFIQTRNCAVTGAVPQWAVDEINSRFDKGLLVK